MEQNERESSGQKKQTFWSGFLGHPWIRSQTVACLCEPGVLHLAWWPFHIFIIIKKNLDQTIHDWHSSPDFIPDTVYPYPRSFLHVHTQLFWMDLPPLLCVQLCNAGGTEINWPPVSTMSGPGPSCSACERGRGRAGSSGGRAG